MTINNHFLLHAVERMSQIAPISYRRIFNGYGIYHLGVQFAIIINDRLYLRADEQSRHLYLAKHMTAFLPAAITTGESNFFQLPNEVLSQTPELLFWMRVAIDAANDVGSSDVNEFGTNMTTRHSKLR